MVICHRKSGYTIAEETTGERLTLCACAQLHRARPPTRCRQEDTQSHCRERGNSHESAVIMDRNRTDRNRKQKYGHYDSITEPEYDVVDDQEDVHSVRILPARPLNEEREYADRNLPRSASDQALSSRFTGKSNILPRCPPRVFPFISGPAVNRDLKPGRKKTRLDERVRPMLPRDQVNTFIFLSNFTALTQVIDLTIFNLFIKVEFKWVLTVLCTVLCSSRRSPSPPPFTLELARKLPGLTLHESSRRDQQRATKKVEGNLRVRDLQSAGNDSGSYINQRHSLDLETHQLDMRSQQHLERVSSKRHHHEWPQTKEDIDQHDFVPMEKPQQTNCEEDWYVGPCSRADAEHALHLVNKDGAFLVRDCSVNSNSEPLVLAVYHEKKVYNVKIRFMESNKKFALGTGQRSNDMFNSVTDIIKFHSIFPIILVSGRTVMGSKYPENCVLTCPVTKRDVDMLLQ
ncbi:uncharacterized protein LOC128362815 [Scomber japonicus]|uniref:uncharacterized protein LOC128362815 n=1 Tax=Scomber japonicus TaxID=13676 RepID=UPI0023052064|nr:uncharacterized protein LOC128362815 [Scomber japonicus]